MNNHTTTPNQRLTLISKNGGIHVGWVEESKASPALTDPIQLELDFNQQPTTNEQPITITTLTIQQPPTSTAT